MFRFAGLVALGAAVLVVLIAVGGASAAPTGGPDASVEKYRWKDYTAAGCPAGPGTSTGPCPASGWTEISPLKSGSGTAVAFPNPFANPEVTQYSSSCVPLGFSFTYYGVDRDCAWVQSNGGHIFLSQAGGPNPSPAAGVRMPTAAMPSAGDENGIIAPFWAHLSPHFCNNDFYTGKEPAATVHIFTKTVGAAPSRTFIVEWSGVTMWHHTSAAGASTCSVNTSCLNTGTPCMWSTFEVKLYEDSDNIDVVLKDVNLYASAPPAADAYAIGIESPTAVGLGYEYSTAGGISYTNRYVRFYPNHPPTPDPVSATVDEDSATPVSIVLTGTDPDGDTTGTCTVTSAPAKGSLTGAGCTFSYKPTTLDFCGADTFGFTMTDSFGLAGTAPGTATVNVRCVNDAPDFTIPATATFSDAAAILKPGFATAIRAGPTTAADEAAQALKFIVTASDPSVFSVAPVIAPAGFGFAPWSGDLGFTPVPGSCSKSPVTVSVQLKDGSGTTPGAGVDLSEVKTFELKLTCGNVPPPPPPPPPATDGDWDRDGYLDSREIISGSDPRNPASTPLDLDADGVPNDPALDNCPTDPNADQRDSNGDRRGDVCQSRGALGPDADRDTWANDADNCPTIVNLAQTDTDHDQIGDACDDDLDGDGADNNVEIAAKSSPFSAASTPSDRDGDGVVDTLDNCKDANPDQRDANRDGVGDVCTPTRKPGLNATATYDGRRLIVNWNVVGEAHLRTVAEVLEGTTPVMASATEAGAGHKRAAFELPNLEEVTWRVRLSDPYDPTVSRVVDGKARVPPPTPPRDPAVIEQPAAALVGNAFSVAYDLPPGTTVATLELTAPDGAVRQVPLAQGQGTTWSGAAVTPLEGKYTAALRYSLQGSQRTYDTGEVAARPAVKAPAVQTTPANLVPAVLGGLGILVLLAAIGLVTVGLATMARRRAAARAAAEAAHSAQPQAEEPTIEGPGYDEPIRM